MQGSAMPPEAMQSSLVGDSFGSSLAAYAQRFGFALSPEAIERCVRHAALLSQWGQKMNLTAVQAPGDILTQHFLDCLWLVSALPPPDSHTASGRQMSLVDVGSGAGFPGVMCAILRPDLRVTLVERVGKKAAFLQTLRRHLDLSYEVEACDADRLVTQTSFDYVVSRAAIPPPKWLPWAKRLLAPRGRIFTMTTPKEPVPQVPGLCAAPPVLYDVGTGARVIWVHAPVAEIA